MTDRASAPGRASGTPKMKERMTTHRRPVYAVLHPSTDELTLATFEGEALVRINRSEAVRLAVDILDLFDAAAALSSPSVADRPTPKERHLMDVYDSLGVRWGDDVFSAIHRLKAAAESPTWQPIETAPNGTLLLLCSMLATEARQWCYVDWLVLGKLCGDRSRPAPTHWMPLPSAPSPSAAAQQETP